MDQIPKTPPIFETSLAIPLSLTDTSATLANGAVIGGQTLVGLVCLSVDIGQPNPEYMVGIINGINVTGLIRGIDPFTPTGYVSNPALIESHRRGANVKITDFVSISMMADIFNGHLGIQAILKYLQSQNFYAALQIPDLEYVQSLLASSILPPNITNVYIGNTGSLQVSSQNITVVTENLNRFIYASFTTESGVTVSAATYDSIAMTQVGTQVQGNVRITVFRITNPSLGSHTLAVTLSGASLLAWEILAMDTVDQTTPYTAGSTGSGSSTSATGSVTTVVANALLVHALATRLIGISYTAGTGENIIADNDTGDVQGAIEIQSIFTPAATNTQIGLSSSTNWANIVGAINGIYNGPNILGDLDMHGFKVINMADATNPQDAVTLSQLQSAVIAGALPASTTLAGIVLVATQLDWDNGVDYEVVGPNTYLNTPTITMIKQAISDAVATATGIFQQFYSLQGSSINAASGNFSGRGTASTDGNKVYFLYSDAGGSTVELFEKDTVSGIYYPTANVGISGYAAMVLIEPYLYISYRVGTTVHVDRYDSSTLAFSSAMTFSPGLTSSTANKTMYTDGTDLYIYIDNSSPWNRYTISGTTLTLAGTVSSTFDPEFAVFDGTNVITCHNDTYYSLVPSTGVINNSFSRAYRSAGFPFGISSSDSPLFAIPISTDKMYLGFGISNSVGTTSSPEMKYAVLNLLPVERP